MLENISQAFEGIWGHKLRSFLTMLGIIIGIASIITIVSTITGTNQQIKENLVGSGTNTMNVVLTMSGNEIEFDYMGVPSGVAIADEDTKEKLLQLNSVEDASYYRYRSWADSVYSGYMSFSGSIYGVEENYLDMNEYDIIYGRGFTEKDISQKRKVAILDDTAVNALLNGEKAVGSTILIKGEPFTIIGVVSQLNAKEPVIESVSDYQMYVTESSGCIYIPLNSWDVVYKYDEPVSVCVKATDTDSMTSAGKEAADLLNDELVKNELVKYQSINLAEKASTIASLTSSANSQLIWIAAISLLVGGIGVMNIMLVSVTERTREIGLKIAIGAPQSKIRMQFLTEAAVLTSIGGILGVLIGIGLSYVISGIMEVPVAISVPACIISVVFSMIIGIVFGLVPAVQASKLNPIEALRHE